MSRLQDLDRRSFLRLSAGAGIATVATLGVVAYKIGTGRDFFVSGSGSDANSGWTDTDPWQSITRVNNAIADGTIKSGDTIKFRRGDEFFGNIRTQRLPGQSSSRLGLTAYGSGARPIISAYKVVDGADAWTPVAPQLWRVDLADPANLSGNTENRSANVGFIRVDGRVEGAKKWGIDELRLAWDFYSDGRYLHVYLPENPTKATGDLRVAVDGPIISGSSNLLVAGIDIVGSGGNGYQQSGATNTEIADCLIHEVGGSAVADKNRYGNGIDLAMGSSSAHVRFNDIFDVYDSAYSVADGIQGSTLAASNCTFQYNRAWNIARVFRYGAYGLVHSPASGAIGCSVNDNLCMNSGRPWGSAAISDRPGIGSFVTIDGQHPVGTEITRNTFFDAHETYMSATGGEKNARGGCTMNDNVIVLRPGTVIQYPGDYTAEHAYAWAAATGHDTNSDWLMTLSSFQSPHDAINYVASHSDDTANLDRLFNETHSARVCVPFFKGNNPSVQPQPCNHAR